MDLGITATGRPDALAALDRLAQRLSKLQHRSKTQN